MKTKDCHLKFSASCKPSRFYLNAIIGTHVLSSLASLCVGLNCLQQTFIVITIACSLCWQLKCYVQYAGVLQLVFEGGQAKIFSIKTGIPHLLVEQQNNLPLEIHQAQLLTYAWVSPKLVVLYFQKSNGRRGSLPVLADSMSLDEFRRLKIFVLNGFPLLTRQHEQEMSKQ